MKNLSYTLFGLFLFLTFCSPRELSYQDALEQNDKKLETEEARSDARFMVEAANYHLVFKNLAQIAADSGYAKIVSDFAQQMLVAQNKYEEDLKAVAREYKVKLPLKMSPKYQSLMEELRDTSKRDFDRTFLNAIETLHEKAVRDFEQAALNANASEVRSFAAAKLDMIRKHEKKANQLVSELL